MTVTQVSAMVKLAVADSLPPKVRVIGQVSNLSDRAHWFFSLKDDQSQLRCVCFASVARRIRFAVEDGMEVVATGRIDYYESQGQLQLYVEKLDPVGEGALALQFRALCDELRTLGYFDPEHKQPLPSMPRRIAIVTSRSAAALGDVIDTAARRWPGCRLVLCDVRVQGDLAADEIAAAVADLSRRGADLGIEAIILTRGGGSAEDLWGFNERVVADAVYRCSLPIVAAIGHETDTTVAELVADARCATPTQAAMALVPDRKALAHQLHQLTARLTLLVRRRYEHGRHRLAAAMRRPGLLRPGGMYDSAAQRLAGLSQQLDAAMRRQVESRRRELESLGRQLNTVGPMNVLQRGYSYTLGADGHLLRTAADAAAGDRITTVLVDGKVISYVESPAGKAAKTRRRRAGGAEADQKGLFDTG